MKGRRRARCRSADWEDILFDFVGAKCVTLSGDHDDCASHVRGIRNEGRRCAGVCYVNCGEEECCVSHGGTAKRKPLMPKEKS